MLTILGRDSSPFCDGLSRRSFLRMGALGLGGLTLPQLLRAESESQTGRSHKAVIAILLPGGPPHQDMFDLKPDAPVEIRGEFKPIATNVPGIQICELMPRLAAMMDRFAIIRSLADSHSQHDLYQCMTGYPREQAQSAPAGGRPAIGAWVSRLAGQADRSIPAHLSLMYPTGERRWGDPGDGGFLGMGHSPFRLVDGENDKNSVQSARNMVLQGITLDQLQERGALRQAFDGFRQKAETNRSALAMDEFAEQALGILTSSKLRDALDVSKEDPKLVERYGPPDPKYIADGAPRVTTNFLRARRLVEAGARFVSLNFSRWDWHGDNFKQGRRDLPLLDQALSALVQDLHDRGLARDVSVIVWGEFGRTPTINKGAGRDHWPRANFALLAGGGMRTGQIIGSTDKHAAEPKDRPVKFHEVFATLFHNLGIKRDAERVFDLRGRPHEPIDPEVQPLRELI